MIPIQNWCRNYLLKIPQNIPMQNTQESHILILYSYIQIKIKDYCTSSMLENHLSPKMSFYKIIRFPKSVPILRILCIPSISRIFSRGQSLQKNLCSIQHFSSMLMHNVGFVFFSLSRKYDLIKREPTGKLFGMSKNSLFSVDQIFSTIFHLLCLEYDRLYLVFLLAQTIYPQ